MIHIVYEPLLAGKLIGQIISMFSIGQEKQIEMYKDNNIDSKWWTQREDDFIMDPDIEFVKGHSYRFKHFLDNYDKMILLSCNTQKEKDLLESRVGHVKHGIMNNPFLIDVRVFYLQELYDYLVRNKKDFYNIPFADVWDVKKFPATMIGCLEWLGLPHDENKIKYAQKQWIKSNIIRRSQLTLKERNAYYEYLNEHARKREDEIRRAGSVGRDIPKR